MVEEGRDSGEAGEGADSNVASDKRIKVPEPLWSVFSAPASMLLLDNADTQSSHGAVSTASSPRGHRKPSVQVNVVACASATSPRALLNSLLCVNTACLATDPQP